MSVPGAAKMGDIVAWDAAAAGKPAGIARLASRTPDSPPESHKGNSAFPLASQSQHPPWSLDRTSG